MSVAASKAQLNDAMKTLHAQWRATREQWQDAAAQRFEDNHLATAERSVHAAVRAMDQLDEVLRRIQRDCE